MTVKELAQRLDITEQAIYAWFSGRNNIAVRHARKLMELSGEPLGDILNKKPADIKAMIEAI